MFGIVANTLSGYFSQRSLRFRSSASANLSRTFTSSATWTFSGWVKRGNLGVVSPLLGDGVKFLAGDTLTAGSLTTTAVYRDPSAWYHVFVSNSGLYINGVSIGSVTTSALTNPKIGSNGTNYFDGLLAEIYFIDGTSLTPSSFGSFDPTTGVWIPKSYTGSYGTNGFYLPFSDNSGLTTSSNTGLGKDFSGNGNYWATNNISLTAGATYDSFTDVPTLTSSSAANYCVMNPLLNANASTITNGNLDVTTSATGFGRVVGSMGVSSGKWYWEVTPTNLGAGMFIGIASADSNATTYVGGDATSYGYYDVNGNKYNNTTAAAYGSAYVANDVIGIALDLSAGTLTFYKNNVSQGTAYTGLSGAFVPAMSDTSSGSSVATFNFGQRPFTYTAPSGFRPLNTFNLPVGSVTTSGSFTGNATTDGPFVYLNGTPNAMTINGNAVTFGTHADKLANGFKVRSSSTSYNTSGSNTYSVSTVGNTLKYALAQSNP